MVAGKANPTQNFAEGRLNGEVRTIVASKLGIGSGETYRKEKIIVDNRSSLTPEDFADWDEEDKNTVVNPDGNRGNHYPDDSLI